MIPLCKILKQFDNGHGWYKRNRFGGILVYEEFRSNILIAVSPTMPTIRLYMKFIWYDPSYTSHYIHSNTAGDAKSCHDKSKFCFRAANIPWYYFNTLGPRQNGRHFADDISGAFSSMKMFEFRFKIHWSLFLVAQLTIIQHWFR